MTSTIFKRSFATSQEGVQTLQNLANSEGFSIRVRTSKPKSVYLVCSREGLPDPLTEPRRRQRQSSRCQCQWRIVLHRNLSLHQDQWTFRPSEFMEHNHSLDTNIKHGTELESLQSNPPTTRASTTNSDTESLPSIHTLFPFLHMGVNFHPSCRNSEPSQYSSDSEGSGIIVHSS